MKDISKPRILSKKNYNEIDVGIDSVEGIAAYIMKLNVRNVGKKIAHEIARHYHGNAFDVIMNDPERLCRDIACVGRGRAFTLQQAVIAKFGPELKQREREKNERQLQQTAFFGSIGIGGWTLRAIIDKYGDDAEAVIRENPYRLTDIDGFGFKRADEIASKVGIERNDPQRLHAGLLYVLQTKSEREGHCYVPKAELLTYTSKELDIEQSEALQNAVTELETDRKIINEDGNIYLYGMYEAEVSVASTLRVLMQESGLPPSRITEWGMALREKLEERDPFWTLRKKAVKVEYNELQQRAIDMADTFRVMILTGGPGTGKTTTLLGILNNMRQRGLFYKMCAPTGRAAQRMKESTGEDAQTIHRLLEYHPAEGFRRNMANPLECDAVIVDEASMIDIKLMQYLCEAIPSGGRLIIVGDDDQLPSVGAGNVLHDLIDSGAIPTVKLTEIHRQKAGSLIVQNAHRVIHGKMPIVENMAGSDFFLKMTGADGKPITEDEVVEEIRTLVSERLPNAYPGMEIQVLCPMRQRGDTCCDTLNPILQEAINQWGYKMKYGGVEYREGDRVMQMKNDYDLGVMNGDVGDIERVNESHNELYVQYADQRVKYESANLRNLQLCYATTIHKSQGSEYDIVVIPVMESASIMLQRNLLYTAITRAKRVCIILGTYKSIRTAVENWMIKPRWTGLKERLKR